MEFIDLRHQAPPAPPAPAMPYCVEATVVGAMGVERTCEQKLYGDGRRELLTADEVAVWRRVQWLEAALVAPPAEPAPELPYGVQVLTFGGFGVFRQHPTKIRASSYGEAELLTPDEIRAWEFLQTLEERFKSVQVERELSVLDGPTIPPAVAARLSDPIGPDVPQPAPAAVSDGPPVTKRQLAEAELLRDGTRTNVEIGELLNCSSELVRIVRKELESVGRLQPTPVLRRDGTAYPTRDAAQSPTDASHG